MIYCGVANAPRRLPNADGSGAADPKIHFAAPAPHLSLHSADFVITA